MNAALRHMSISDVAMNIASQHHETWLAGTYWASAFNKPAGDGPAGFFYFVANSSEDSEPQCVARLRCSTAETWPPPLHYSFMRHGWPGFIRPVHLARRS
jgi:hypothetical protein